MNILDLIRSRRNIKKFKADAVEPNLIQQWLEAAAMAPNHRMTEPWEVYMIGPETRKKLNHKTNFGNAPIVMAVLSRQGATKIETDENAAATACFIQNFNLAAWSEGVGTFWSSIAIKGSNQELLQVPENYDVLGVIAVGYPEEVPEVKPRTPMREKMKYLP
ncbi:nitroreductase [Neobacillus sp. YIM B02564]|uniref:Nitroreductase n=1 Tax=Neobacillus paridis TaxID=2803862 RepID=A0ABS1THF3_9BACI|nr:nitroreductase [Neobacillus paridis]MBL4950754.1 nitroreductase [Neobacillus paridis]